MAVAAVLYRVGSKQHTIHFGEDDDQREELGGKICYDVFGFEYSGTLRIHVYMHADLNSITDLRYNMTVRICAINSDNPADPPVPIDFVQLIKEYIVYTSISIYVVRFSGFISTDVK